jgi:hypothetical protein
MAIESRQLQIRDILIAMTMLAVTLGIMSLVAKRGDAGFLIDVVMACGVAAVWSTLVLPICVRVCFAASPLVVRIVALIGYGATLAIIAVGVVTAFAIKGVSINPSDFGLTLAAYSALLATLFSGLGLARACGYVLVSVPTTRRHGSASRQPPPGPPGWRLWSAAIFRRFLGLSRPWRTVWQLASRSGPLEKR